MEYGYSGFDENSKVRMLINGINTNTLNACKAAIPASQEMQGEFYIAAKNFFDFIAITPSIQKNATAKVSSMKRNGGGSGSDCGSGMPVESDVQAAMSSSRINTSMDLNGVMYPRRSAIIYSRSRNKLFTTSEMNNMVAAGLMPETELPQSMLT